jgi:CYTH domain-containing protein
MAIEIERRFLVRDPQAAIANSTIANQCHIRQGYLGWVDGLRLRVRVSVDRSGQRTAVLTLKCRRRGAYREEYEHPLGLDRAEQILAALPPTRIICKTRYRLHYWDGLVWSIDRFEGLNQGLVIAEVELVDPEQRIELPPGSARKSPSTRATATLRWHNGRSETVVSRWLVRTIFGQAVAAGG